MCEVFDKAICIATLHSFGEKVCDVGDIITIVTKNGGGIRFKEIDGYMSNLNNIILMKNLSEEEKFAFELGGINMLVIEK